MPTNSRQPLIAVQAVLPLTKVSEATAIIVFFQFLGGAVFLAVAHNVFQSRLLMALMVKVPSEDAQMIVKAGAGAVRQIVQSEDLHLVLEAYNIAITDTFVSTVLGSL